jgi:CRP-like cAMP-binding protein
VQGVPLIQSVPRSERVGMISQAQIREFREGEYIIKQGEVGEELFIILEGACEVVEDKNFLRSTSKDDKDKLSGKDEEKVPNIVKLVTLREGHFFGEMSLMTVRTLQFYISTSCCCWQSLSLEYIVLECESSQMCVNHFFLPSFF